MAEGPVPKPRVYPRGDPPTTKNPTRPDRPAGLRAEFESVDLDDIEEVPPSSEDVTDGIDIEFEEAQARDRDSVNKLLAMTGEQWSIDSQIEDLKEAAKDREKERKESPAPPAAKPAVSIPTPWDFGGAAEVLRTGDITEHTDPQRIVPRS